LPLCSSLPNCNRYRLKLTTAQNLNWGRFADNIPYQPGQQLIWVGNWLIGEGDNYIADQQATCGCRTTFFNRDQQ
jgi:hypothetical protein